MLQPQQTLNLSSYGALYDLLIPKEDELRRIHDEIDMSFVYTELVKNYCDDNGRIAEDPIRMFRYLLLKVICDLSDAAVVKRAKTDLLFKYFLDLSPEETNLIDPSSLCKFRKLRLKDVELMNLLIGKTISVAKQKGLIKKGTIIIDATHTTARAISYNPVEYLRLRVNRLSKSLEELREDLVSSFPMFPKEKNLEQALACCKEIVGLVRNDEIALEIPAAKNHLELLEEAMDDALSRTRLSYDRDARGGYKSVEKSFFGTKEHIGIEAESGLVCAAIVSSGEKTDGRYLEEVIEQSRKNGIDVNEAIADKAYSTLENLELADRKVVDAEGNPKKNFTLYSEIHKNITKVLDRNDGFYFNKDAGRMTCPAGHLSIGRSYNPRNTEKKNNPHYEYKFDVEKCKICPLREGCYKPGAKHKYYVQTILPDVQKEHIEFEKTKLFRDKMKERYKIEAKNADLKHNYGLDKATSYGLENMTMQTALSIFACNLKRIMRLTKA
ncbi:MAG: IS1182 family transposase [Bacteroidales bacterium]|nr:IS1182 family transposase [Bacteroidales bacterium]